MEGGRQGKGESGLFAGNPRRTMAIWPWRQTCGPLPFWANLSSTPRATSEARAAPPFGVNLAVTNVAG